MKTATTALALGLAVFAVAATTGAASAQQITGAGSTFAAPIYGKWADAAGEKSGIKLNYQAIGSGAGINQINNRTVDFGASDMPLKGDQLAEHKLMQFPTVIGGVDVIVNLPNIAPNELKLTGPDPGRHLHGHHYQVERPEDRRGKPRPEAAEHGDRAGAPR